MADKMRTWTPKKALLAASLIGLVCLLVGFGIGWLTARFGTEETVSEPVERPAVFWDENDPGEMRLREFLKSPYLKDRLPVSPPPLAGDKNPNAIDPEPSRLEIALVDFRKPLCDAVAPAQASAPERPGLSEEPAGAEAASVGDPPPSLEGEPKARTLDISQDFLPAAPVVTGRGPESGALQGLEVPDCLRKIAPPEFPVSNIREEPEPGRFGLMPAFIAADWLASQGAVPERLSSASSQAPWPGAFPAPAPKAGHVPHAATGATPGPDLVQQRPDDRPHARAARRSPASLADPEPPTIPFPRPEPEVVLADRPAEKPVEKTMLAVAGLGRPSPLLPASSRPLTVSIPDMPRVLDMLVAKRPESRPAPAVGAAWPALAAPLPDIHWPAHESQMPGLYTPADLTPAPVPRSAPTLPWP